MSYPTGGFQPPMPERNPDDGRTNKIVGYLIGGLVIGPILAVGFPLLGLAIASGATTEDDTPFAVGLIAGLAAPILLPIPLLFARPTRPWGVGIMAGAALTLIVFGGLCAAIIYSFNNSSV